MLGLAVNNATKHVNYGTFRIFPFQATPSERPPASLKKLNGLCQRLSAKDINSAVSIQSYAATFEEETRDAELFSTFSLLSRI